MSPTVLLAVVTGCMMLQPLSTDLYLASLPHLAGYFDVAAADVQQTLSLFVVGFGTAQLIGGPLSDRFGRRPVLLWGMGIYVLASIACGLAPTLTALVAARFLQAVGCCTAVVVARAIIRDSFSPSDGARMIAKASTLLSFAPLLGPIAGGYLQVAFGWRAAFAVMAAFAVGVGILGAMRMTETNRHKNPEATRPTALVRDYGVILRTPSFWAYTLPGALSYAAIFAFISGSSFVLIRVLGVPTQYYGYCFAFGVCGYLLGTIVCRRLLGRLPLGAVLGYGSTLSVAAGWIFLALAVVGIEHWAVVLGCQFLTMLAHGINFPCAQSGSAAPFPRQAGAAAGLLGFMTMFAAFLSGVAVGATHNGTLVPLATISAGVGSVLWGGAMLLRRHR